MKAAEAAVIIAGQLHTNLVLLNCNDTISAVTYYPAVPVMSDAPTWYEDRKAKLKDITEHLKEQFKERFPGQAMPTIKSLISEGDLYANIKETLKQFPVEMITMGARAGSSTEHFLFGSDTKIVTDQSPVPVLIVPKSMNVDPLKRITFATNFLEQDTETLQYLFSLRKRLGVELDIVNVKQYGTAPKPKNARLMKLIEENSEGKAEAIVYKQVFGKEVISRLNHYCRDNHSDILALSHEHHSFLFRAMREGVVDKSLYGQHLPLLIIPELKTIRKPHTDVRKDLRGIVL